MEEQAKIPVFKASLYYGLIVGLVTIVISLIFYFIGQSFEKWAMYTSLVIAVAVLVLALVLLRKEYGKGFISYGNVVLASVLISLVAAILTSVYTYAIFEFDKEYLQDTKYYALEQIDKRMEKTDAKYQEKLTDEQYDQFASRMKAQKKKIVDKIKNRSAFRLASGNIFNNIFFGLIIGLLAGIFIQKKPQPVIE